MSSPASHDELLGQTLDAIGPLDAEAMRSANERQSRLTKPAGSLGVLEQAAEKLAGIQGESPPRALASPVVAVFAADHGVHAQGVSPWPQHVTAAMVANMRAGGAAVCVLARLVGADVVVVDMGVAASFAEDGAPSARPRLVDCKIRLGTSDLATGPAMSRDEALRGLSAGIGIANDLADRGHDCLLTGDMGIANTTASAALVAALTGTEPSLVTGRGAGIDDPTLAVKVSVVASALRDRPPSDDPVDVLASLGGFEHAGIAGLLLGAAARRVPVILDGVIAGSAALVAQALSPAAVRFWFAGHRSVEPGHVVALERLGLRPLVDLDLRLGEGSGAALAFPLVRASGALLREMATFDTAGVAGPADPVP
jgi:nicotinate-nucleotide--dimethylbenzimidazole phosphoribosyltransferase